MRDPRPKPEPPSFKNPVIAAQVLESPFVPDDTLGHTMPPGKDFIGSDDYLSLDHFLKLAKTEPKKVILNIGDSSTSGWDSNVVTENRKKKHSGEELTPAFFQYKTYSDFLRDSIGEDYYVINAGVPAHTSLQGAKRLEYLLEIFEKENILIELITAYYGNNDSVWDHNRQDKDWVGKKTNKQQPPTKKSNNNSIITRVLPDDYKKSMKSIIDTCKKRGIKLVVIEPITPIYWKPGTRVLNEDLERNQHPGSDQVYRLLDEGRKLWVRALKQRQFCELKRLTLEEVREKDYVVPRIKRNHLIKLWNVVKETNTPLIQVDLDRSKNDIRYFIDYCHPIAGANRAIAKQIENHIKTNTTFQKTENLYIDKKPEQNNQDTEDLLAIPVDHYALF